VIYLVCVTRFHAVNIHYSLELDGN